MKIKYAVDPKDVEEMQKIIRIAFREQLGIEVEFIKTKNGEIKVVPALGRPLKDKK